MVMLEVVMIQGRKVEEVWCLLELIEMKEEVSWSESGPAVSEH